MTGYRADCDCGTTGPVRATEAEAREALAETHRGCLLANGERCAGPCGRVVPMLVDDGPYCMACDALIYDDVAFLGTPAVSSPLPVPALVTEADTRESMRSAA